MQRCLDTLEKLTDDGNLTKFNQKKSRVLQLGKCNHGHHHVLRDTQVESSSAGKGLEFWWFPSCVNQQYAPAAKNANGVLGYVSQSIINRSREVNFSYIQHL